MKKLLMIVLVFGGINMFASSAEINVNSNSVEFGGDMYMHKKGYTTYYFTGRYLNNGEVNDDELDATLTTVGLKAMNQYRVGNHLLKGAGVGMGMDIGILDIDKIDKDFITTPFALYGNLQFSNRLSLDAKYAYSPEILTHGDGTKYSDFKLKVNFRLIDNGYVFIGQRVIKATYEASGGDFVAKLDNDVFAGFRLIF